jgi:S1-C subfamily serine protease
MRYQIPLGLLLKELFRTEERKKKLVSALDEFVQQFRTIGIEQLREGVENLEQGLIEITHCGQHSSNGLLVTEDGYFLTAKHCLDHGLSGLKIRTHKGSTYKIERVCAVGTRTDVALAKATVPAETEPKRYRFYDETQVDKMPIAAMVRRYGHIETNYGYINGNCASLLADFGDGKLVPIPDHFELALMARSGDSGGIVVSPDLRLVGILSAGATKRYTATCIGIGRALELVNFYGKNNCSE